MIMNLRLMRSAQTPANTETTAWGKNPKTADRASTAPDLVVRVRCHMIAYCTSMEPKVVTVCPTKNRATFFFQPARTVAGEVDSGCVSDT